MKRQLHNKDAGAERRRGFTLIETLVVVGLVVVLLTILIIAVAATTSHAAQAKTQTLLSSMSTATSAFQRDHGYLPPVLEDDRDLFPTPSISSGNYAPLQDWLSITSPAEYLIGYSDETQDGYNGVGIRSPGLDGVWGATALSGALADRNPVTKGKVYPPYLELDADDLLGSLDPATGIISRPTDSGWNPSHPRVILDFWGEPIHYYRDHPGRTTNTNADITLGDVYVLRPFRISGAAEAQGAPDATGDTNTTFALKAAEYAFLSVGPDRADNHDLRFDDPADPSNAAASEFVNEDNVVEVGQ